MNIEYPKLTPRLICEEISGLSAVQKKLVKRPWDRFRPDATSWWLVPSSDLLHYRYAKLYFDWANNEQKAVNCGLYVEKGLDESLSSVYASKQAKHLMMNEKWSWHKIIEAFNSSKLYEVLQKTESVLPVNIVLDGGYISEPNSFEPYQDKKIKWDKYCFLLDKSSGKIALESSSRYSYVLKLHNVNTQNELTSALNELGKDQWLWLNLFICIKVPTSINKKINESVRDIYESFLKHLIVLL